MKGGESESTAANLKKNIVAAIFCCTVAVLLYIAAVFTVYVFLLLYVVFLLLYFSNFFVLCRTPTFFKDNECIKWLSSSNRGSLLDLKTWFQVDLMSPTTFDDEDDGA